MKIQVKITRQENADYFNKQIGDIVQVDFEDYIISVVSSEVGNSNLEVCKAQAVAARSFAISRSVFKDRAISDSSSTDQAYRAKLKYGNAIIAVEQTEGQVLYYEGKIANTIYGASNGGQIISAAERWGGKGYPYLISKSDPWDAAAGYAKNGHGVGMSQRGAMYAASIGKNYKEILQFYYPNTYLKEDYGMTKAEQVVVIAKACMGWPYVFGALGEECTPANRKRRASSDHPNIVKKCQYLNGSASSCAGCKFLNTKIFDCRGFTWWCLHQVGVKISKVGATTQWNTKVDWVQRGEIKDMPNVVCCLFKRDGDKMKHTGLHIGNGQIIHCTNANGSPGVTTSSTENKTWTHYAIPKGLYTEDEIKNAGKVSNMVVTRLKRGSTGGAVVELQKKLNQLGFDCGTADGNFGSKTEAAVKAFQEKYGLLVDGIAGAATLTKLDELVDKKEEESETEKPSSDPQSSNYIKDELLKLKEKLNEMNNIIDNILKKEEL